MTQEEKNVVQTVEQEVISPTSDLEKSMTNYSDYLDAENIIRHVQRKSKDILISYYEIAGYLRRFAEKEYYKVLGYSDLFTCCKTLLPDFSETLIKNLILVGNKCFVKASTEYRSYDVKDTYKNISWSKLVELVSIPEDKELVELISDKSVKAIREVKKDIKVLGVDKVKLHEKIIKGVLDKLKSSLGLSKFELKPKDSEYDSSIKYSSTYVDGNFSAKLSIEFYDYDNHVNLKLSNRYCYGVYDYKELDEKIKHIKNDICSLKKESNQRLGTNKLKKQVDKSKAPNRLTTDYEAYAKDLNNWKLLIYDEITKISIYEFSYLDLNFLLLKIDKEKIYFKKYGTSHYEYTFYEVQEALKKADDEAYKSWLDNELKKMKKQAGVKHD